MKIVRECVRSARWKHGENGQSLLELAISIPMLLGLAFNLINFAYYWFVVLALSAAPRNAVQFASQGGYATGSPSFASTPTASSVCNLLSDNFGNAVLHSSTYSCGSGNVQVRVCSSSIGVNADGTTKCSSYGASLITLSAVAADPEQPKFRLQKVDIVWRVTPPIPGSAFGLVLPGNLNFHRQVTMRNLY